MSDDQQQAEPSARAAEKRPYGGVTWQTQSHLEETTERENMNTLLQLLDLLPGRPAALVQSFDHMAVGWTEIDPQQATNSQKATWALLALDDFDATDSRPNTSRTTEETFSEYQDHFRGYTRADFEAMPKQLRAALRTALMRRGIYVGKHNANFAANLANLVTQPQPPEWDSKELDVAKNRWPDALAWRASVHNTERGPVYPQTHTSSTRSTIHFRPPEQGPSGSQEFQPTGDNQPRTPAAQIGPQHFGSTTPFAPPPAPSRQNPRYGPNQPQPPQPNFATEQPTLVDISPERQELPRPVSAPRPLVSNVTSPPYQAHLPAPSTNQPAPVPPPPRTQPAPQTRTVQPPPGNTNLGYPYQYPYPPGYPQPGYPQGYPAYPGYPPPLGYFPGYNQWPPMQPYPSIERDERSVPPPGAQTNPYAAGPGQFPGYQPSPPPPPPAAARNEGPGPARTPGGYDSFSQTAPGPTPGPDPTPGRTPMPVGNQQEQTYYAVPPVRVPNELCPSTIVGQFKKAWNKENNYTGEVYDILEDKFRFFLDVCYTSGIRQTQFHAVFSTILSGRAALYFLHNVPRHWSFTDMYLAMERHFNTEQNKIQYHQDWTSTTFFSTKAENASKSDLEVLQIMLDKLSLCQRALGPEFRGEQQLIAAVHRACRFVPQLQHALFEPATRFEDLASKLRASIGTHEVMKGANQYMVNENSSDDEIYYVDRKYHRNDKGSRYNPKQPKTWKRKCWICKEVGCWSTKHPEHERKEARTQWKAKKGSSKSSYSTFLADYEGLEDSGSDSDDDDEETPDSSDEQFLTAAYLSNQSFQHRVATLLLPDETKPQSDTVFVLDRYKKVIFQGIMPDTGAARVSTAGRGQYQALIKEHPEQPRMNSARAGEANIRFGDGTPLESLGTMTVNTPFGPVDFHVMESDTPFLMSLKDMDRLGVYLNNTTNQLVCKNGVTVQVDRKWGHPWFHLEDVSVSFLTETELRRIHTRFGHPSVTKLYNLLDKAGHDIDIGTIKEVNKFCHHCQVKGKAPQRFKFTLKDPDVDFNYEVIVDVMYLEERPVLHVVDAATGFQAARFIKNVSAKETWEMLRQCWIDTYLGPPDVITHDAGSNFDSTEFRNEARLAGITCHQVPVEAHWSIGKVEEYHGPIRRAYEIITEEMQGTGSKISRLQMAVKAVNDTANPDGLVPTLLVFGAYPRINMDSPPTPSQTQRAQAVQRAMTEIKKIKAQRSVRDSLNTRNGPNTRKTLPMSLPIGSEVLVYREEGGWKSPHKVIAVTDKDVTVASNDSGGTSTFRNTHVKRYTQPKEPTPVKELEVELPKPTFNPNDYEAIPEEELMHAEDLSRIGTLYVTTKERDNLNLAHQLRADGKITTPGKPYEASDIKELNALFEEGILQPEMYDATVHQGATIFKSRMVREIKGKNTPSPYEKSRLVVQGYGDPDKESIMTYAPTIQRASQRLLLALAPMLRRRGMKAMIRDITMAYTQSKTPMQRVIFVRLPSELKNKYPEGTLLRVVKPLYGLAESGTYWFETYSRHHQRELHMRPSAFDPCLLITDSEPFGLTGLQTDDTLNIGTTDFLEAEDKALVKAGIKARPQKILDEGTEDFNGSRIIVHKEGYGITTIQKGQAEKLGLLNTKAPDLVKRFVEQRARGAYISSICQPEAAFDYSTAAQHLEPGPKEAKALNARIKWQMDNKTRGLNYIELDPLDLRLYVFVDGSFANNKDMSSQIGYIIVLGNEEPTTRDNEVRIRGNIIHWSSTKCKRVTRSVLASEIYGMVQGFDVGYVIHHTVNTILERLSLPKAPLVLCTDSFSLYQCLVRMGSTNEKRLMIDLMALRQSYENREIDDIRWIHGTSNPADAMTKASPNETMRTLVEGNQIDLRLEGWVKRE